MAVAAGNSFTITLGTDRTVWAWGSNSNGQLGNGTTTDSYTPLQVPGLAAIMAIAAGNSFALAMENNELASTVWAWGSNNNGQLGNGAMTDVYTVGEVSNMNGTGAIGIAAGYDHAVVVKNDGTVWTWGNNSNGQLGNGTTTVSVVPVQVSGMSGVDAVAAGYFDTVVLKINGTVWTWGYNFYGQLGNGTTTDSSIPVQATLP